MWMEEEEAHRRSESDCGSQAGIRSSTPSSMHSAPCCMSWCTTCMGPTMPNSTSCWMRSQRQGVLPALPSEIRPKFLPGGLHPISRFIITYVCPACNSSGHQTLCWFRMHSNAFLENFYLHCCQPRSSTHLVMNSSTWRIFSLYCNPPEARRRWNKGFHEQAALTSLASQTMPVR